VSVVYIISVAVAAEVKGGCVEEGGDIVAHMIGRPRREKVNIGADAKGNNARKYGRDKG
jgi:hypothetical protein